MFLNLKGMIDWIEGAVDREWLKEYFSAVKELYCSI
jgi:hypothetical protein